MGTVKTLPVNPEKDQPNLFRIGWYIFGALFFLGVLLAFAGYDVGPFLVLLFFGAVAYLCIGAWSRKLKEDDRKLKQDQQGLVVGQSILKTYKGNQTEAIRRFKADAIEMASKGYFPTSEFYAPGQWSTDAFVVAVALLFLFGLGILILGYMLIVKPDGTLTVTYERRAVPEEKTCPMCAERIKAAALVCHFCGHRFAPAEVRVISAEKDAEEVYRGYTYTTAENGEAELRLSSGDRRKFPSIDYLKAYVDALTGNVPHPSSG